VVNLNSGTLVVNGTLTQSGTIEVAAGTTFQKTGSWANNGTIRGSGTINIGAGNTLTNNGTIAPGASSGDTTGTLAVTGHLTNSASGILNMEFSSPIADDYDALVVSGTLTLQSGSTLNLSGLTAASGTYVPLTAGTLSGAFSTINTPDFATVPTYNATNLSLGITGATWLLWDGGGGADTSWGNALNWSTDNVPIGSDNVLIDVAGNPTVMVPSGTFSVNRVSSNEAFTVSGGSLTTAGASTFGDLLTLSSGTLTLNNTTAVNGGLALTGGTLTGSGVVTVANDVQLDWG